MAAVWISLSSLPPELFARRALMSIAAAVGKPISIDKATQLRSRPSTVRVKVILNILDKHPEQIRLKYVDGGTGKIVEQLQQVTYDNLPLYCNQCKHQGHDEYTCRILLGKKPVTHDEQVEDEMDATGVMEKLQGDARDYLNSKRASKLLIEGPGKNTISGQQNNLKATVNDGSKEVVVNKKIEDIQVQQVQDQAGKKVEGVVVNQLILHPNRGQQSVNVNEKANGYLVLANAGQKGDGEGIHDGKQGIAVGDASSPMKAKPPADILLQQFLNE